MRNLSSFRKTCKTKKPIISPRIEEYLGGNAAPEFDEDIVY